MKHKLSVALLAQVCFVFIFSLSLNGFFIYFVSLSKCSLRKRNFQIIPMMVSPSSLSVNFLLLFLLSEPKKDVIRRYGFGSLLLFDKCFVHTLISSTDFFVESILKPDK